MGMPRPSKPLTGRYLLDVGLDAAVPFSRMLDWSLRSRSLIGRYHTILTGRCVQKNIVCSLYNGLYHEVGFGDLVW